MTTTIAAISTPQGTGALGIIRLSGPQAIALADRLFPAKDLLKAPARTLHFGPLQQGGEWIDDVVITLYRAPHSYTGEDVAEISCHGSSYVLQRTMEALLAGGAEPAKPGEFSMRAFANGKMDLSQAEAVADLIASETRAAHDTALQQMRGGFSKKIASLRQQLLDFASLIELELDFAEEDVEFADRRKLLSLLSEIRLEVQHLTDSFSLGNAIKSGVRTVIAGRPNAGKSTLLNALLQEERALVSDIPGTTRDVIEDAITIHGIRFRFMDTAGIRSTTDTLESLGIERTRQKIAEAEIIIYLFDVHTATPAEIAEDLATLPADTTLIIAGNKADAEAGDSFPALFPIADIYLSARQETGLDALKELLITRLNLPEYRAGETIVTNIRHVHALKQVLSALDAIGRGFETALPTDLIAIDIRHALHHLGTITGQVTSDEILGNIFGRFCIGK